MDFDIYHKTLSKRIEEFLETLLKDESPHSHSIHLQKAMQYSVLNGGKRIRPLLVYAIGQATGTRCELLDAPAGAVELIHCYSLIHDDLPAMDNDDLRRGKPSCHKVFGVATAILAGDALQTLAFEILSDEKLNPLPAAQQIQMINILARKTGFCGMVDGQALDIEAEQLNTSLSFQDLSVLHQNKTGALIEASILLGALSNGSLDTNVFSNLTEYARCIGLAYQIQDDILDWDKDEAQKKVSFLNVLRLDEARRYVHTLYNQALEHIRFLGKNEATLSLISDLLINRTA